MLANTGFYPSSGLSRHIHKDSRSLSALAISFEAWSGDKPGEPELLLFYQGTTEPTDMPSILHLRNSPNTPDDITNTTIFNDTCKRIFNGVFTGGYSQAIVDPNRIINDLIPYYLVDKDRSLLGGKYPKGWLKSILFVWELRFLCHSISHQKVYLIDQIIRYSRSTY